MMFARLVLVPLFRVVSGVCPFGSDYAYPYSIGYIGQKQGMINICKSHFCEDGYDGFSTNADGHDTCLEPDSPGSERKCVTGTIRCEYSTQCNGHYYWYHDISFSDGYCGLDKPDPIATIALPPVAAPEISWHPGMPGLAQKVGSCDSKTGFGYATNENIKELGQTQGIINLCKRNCDNGHFNTFHPNRDGHETCIVEPEDQFAMRCVSGDVRCEYDVECDGHYYWYVNINPQNPDTQFCGHLPLEFTTTTTTLAPVAGPALEVMQCESNSTSGEGYATGKHIEDLGQGHGMDNLCIKHFCQKPIWEPNMDGKETCLVKKPDGSGELCVSGWIRCEYDDPCNGHYYWYVKISPSDGYCGDLRKLDNTSLLI